MFSTKLNIWCWK